MVEILCPHCEGEIELDDDASGEFECPLCGGEFEWNMDGDDSYEASTYPNDAIITTDFREMSAVPKVAGIAFCVWMVLVIGMGLMAMIGGCSGSTTGGIKVARWMVIKKEAKCLIKQTLHPRAVVSVFQDQFGAEYKGNHASLDDCFGRNDDR